MKKIISLVTGILLCVSVIAQSASQNASTMTTVGSPVVNTATATSTLKVSGVYKSVAIQAVITKVSGTVAGTVTLQGSLDGVNYVTVPTAATVAGAATYTATDVATQSTVFLVNNAPYLYYRLSYTGSGTMNASLASYLLPK